MKLYINQVDQNTGFVIKAAQLLGLGTELMIHSRTIILSVLNVLLVMVYSTPYWYDYAFKRIKVKYGKSPRPANTNPNIGLVYPGRHPEFILE